MDTKSIKMGRSLIYLFLAIFFYGIYYSVVAGELSPELMHRIRGSRQSDKIDILIRMDKFASFQGLQKLKHENKTNAARHQIGIDRLKVNAHQSQENILATLRDMESMGLAVGTKGHWLVNVVSVRVAISELNKLADRSDVLEVQLAPHLELIAPGKSEALTSTAFSAGVQPNLTAIGADQAWQQGLTGEGRIVCSFDTGIDGIHPALFDNWKGHDGDSSSAWYDPLGKEPFPHVITEAAEIIREHGTHVMGIMVGHDDITGDTIGVAPDAKWISAAVIDLPYVSIIDAFEWAADPDGDPNTFDDVPDVINHSWSVSNTVVGCNDYLWEMLDNIEALGIVNIFAAGNEGSLAATIGNPANRANDSLDCFAVGAFNHLTITSNKIVSESSRGPSDCDGVSIKPNVVAPGIQVYSSIPGGEYVVHLGTSMAAPHVSGAVAILRQYAPNSTPGEIKEALLASCTPYPDEASSPNNDYGWGLINLPAAIAYLTPIFNPDLKISSYGGALTSAGETASGDLTVTNSGQLVNNVYGNVINSETGLTVLTPTIYFGNIDSGQTAVGDIPFQVLVDDTVSAGRILSIDMTLTGDDSYSKAVKIFMRVGAEPGSGKPGFFTHETASVSFTISSFGQYGFGPGSIWPLGYTGFTFNEGTDDLVEAAFMLGTDIDHVSDGATNFAEIPDNDFMVIDGGGLDILNPGPTADWETTSIFNDNFAENPLSLEIAQKTYVWSGASNEDFIIFEYEITNKSDTAIENIFAGLFFDWDIVTYLNCGGYSPDERLGYMFLLGGLTDSSEFRGLAVLNSEGIASYRLREIPSVNPLRWSEADKFAALSEGLVDITNSGSVDLGQVISTGPFDLSSGHSDTALFAVLAADNLVNLRLAAVQADYQYYNSTDLPFSNDIQLPENYVLLQNRPNPFNTSTIIEFVLRSRQEVRLSVYNILGKQVADILDKNLPAGFHFTVWNGIDNNNQPVSSGIYFYRLATPAGSQTRKMLLLK